MRFLLAAIIWLTLIGGLYGYTTGRDRGRENDQVADVQVKAVRGTYSISVTATFSSERDPFALQGDQQESGGFELWLNGRRMERAKGDLEPGLRLLFPIAEGMVEGGNEVYVKASPPVSVEMEEYALRLQLLESGSVLKDTTFWGSNGATITGTMTVELGKGEEDEHGH